MTIMVVVSGLFYYKNLNTYSFKLLSSKTTRVYFNNYVQESDSLNIMINEYIYNGGGVALADFNNDGLEDIYFTGNVVDNKLYLNKGDLKFEDITIDANASCSNFWCMGVSTIDINNDGLMDMYISVSGKVDSKKRRNILLLNKGIDDKGIPHFKDEAQKYGLDHDGYSIHSYFLDYDRDGLMDMYLINNHFTNRGDVLSKRKMSDKYNNKNVNILYRNINGEYFEDVTKKSGLINDGFSLGASILDVNNDGWDDIFVSNDFVTSSTLFINQTNGMFEENIGAFFKYQSFSSMGVDAADFNNDGKEDVITLDMLPNTLSRTKRMFSKSNFLYYDLLEHYGEKPQYMRNSLYVNNNYNHYNEISQLLGVHNTDWSWAPIFADFDNDGLKDLYITNGFPRDLTDLDFINYRDSYQSILNTNQGLLNRVPRVKISNFMYKNLGNFSFENKNKNWKTEIPSYSNGLGVGDLDNDGDLEIVVNNINDNAFIFENDLVSTMESFLKVKLRGKNNNRMALHSKVDIFYNDSLKQSSRVNPYRGYLSSISSILHFGLGKARIIDSLKVYWKDDKVSTIKELAVNKLHTIAYDSHKKIAKEKLNSRSYFKEVAKDLGLVFEHRENKSYDFFVFELQQRVYSNEGPPLVIGDINQDNMEDIIIGDASGGRGVVFYQNKDSIFSKKELEIASLEKELTALALLDVDNDKDLDLYLGYGHNNTQDSIALKDEIALNDGMGNFTLAPNLLPDFYDVTSNVVPFDFDKDGDIDIFIASRADIFQYPNSPKSYFLINENGIFKEKNNFLPREGKLGMLTDAVLLDVNKDGLEDIIICGEWMGIFALINRKDFFEIDKTIFPENINGWWNSLLVDDLDNDGDLDIVATNHGWNTPYKPTKKRPLLMKYNDFNKNGRNEPLIFYFTEKDYYPIHLRDNFLNQLQRKKKQFPNYKSYSTATIDEVLTPEENKKAKTLKTHIFSSMVFENKNNKFYSHILPVEAQFSPMFVSLAKDIDKDGKKEIILAGNDNSFEVFTGPKNATQGVIFSVDKTFRFKKWEAAKNNFSIPFSAKKMKIININKKNVILAAQNNEKLKAFEIIKNQKK